jgi:hypothetical protein
MLQVRCNQRTADLWLLTYLVPSRLPHDTSSRSATSTAPCFAKKTAGNGKSFIRSATVSGTWRNQRFGVLQNSNVGGNTETLDRCPQGCLTYRPDCYHKSYCPSSHWWCATASCSGAGEHLRCLSASEASFVTGVQCWGKRQEVHANR